MAPHLILAPCSFKFASGEQPGVFRGFASTFGGKPDSYGDVVDAGAFANTLAEHRAAGTRPAMLWSHEMSEPIGVWLDVRESPDGLEAAGRLALDVTRGAEAYALMKAGALALSIGYSIRKGGSRFEGGVRHLTDLDLHEVSAVAIPANPNARIVAVKAATPSPRDLEAALRDACGLSVRQAKRLMADGYAAMVRDEPAPGEAEFAAAINRIIKA